MKLLSLWEPWASLMAIGAKRIETRDWATKHRGWLAIQASKSGLGKAELVAQCEEPFFSRTLHSFDPFPGNPDPPFRRFPFGHIVAVVNVMDCLPTVGEICNPGVFDDYPLLNTPHELAFGNYDKFDAVTGRRRFGFVTDKLFRLPQPIAYKAHQGINTLTPALVAEIQAQGFNIDG